LFKRLDPYGNPNVGVYVRATSRHLWVPRGLTQQNVADLEAALGLEAVTASIGGSTLIGSLVAANAHGAVVADIATDDELEVLRAAGLDVVRLEHTRLNAAGNNILCNDKGAIVHEDLPDSDVAAISAALGVPVQRGTIAGIATVGTAGVATNRGALAHPLATEADLSFIRQSLHVPARIGTVNHGHGLVGAGLAANQNGVAAGSRTTGIELGRIEEALGFLDEKTVEEKA
jgi:translation initiation factor 6